MDFNAIKLTQYSHGAGCGCKISPKILDTILKGNIALPNNENLIVGNNSKDDAAVYNLGNDTALISTTDFFMPIVDNPFNFGKIAAANAISDVYAMGGKPILAIAILGWPINVLPAEVAQQVIDGAKSICAEANISLAGGHSIDSPEPIFGLAVNGIVSLSHLKQNNTAKENDMLFLTKPIGVGILSTAEKKGILLEEHTQLATNQMMQLNKVGEALGKIKGVSALTDVTGFGLLGHACEMAEGSNISIVINYSDVPIITEHLPYYIDKKAVPGGNARNLDSYGNKISPLNSIQSAILADPQTSGGLLIAVNENSVQELVETLKQFNLQAYTKPIGYCIKKTVLSVIVQ
jgi:selenide, water dikinase